MRPLDPRLLRHARATRSFLVIAAVVGVLTAAAVIVQAALLGHTISAAFQSGATLATLRPALVALAVVVVVRASLAWATEAAAHRAAAEAKSQLRSALLEHAIRLGPGWLSGARTGELVTLATRGVDALDGYFARYLPQLALAVVVPVAVVVTLAFVDPVSAVIVACTIPLIPLFMALIGRFTQQRVDQQWRTLSLLSGHYLDTVAGLPTLKVFGRSREQETSVATVGEQYRHTTMGVLRVSFLSSFALELLATLSVAVVAVSIGVRLVGGDLDLRAGLTALLLAPEAYLPLRLVGQHFHAAAEGVGAAERVIEVLETEPGSAGTRTDLPDLAATTLRIEGLAVTYPGRSMPAVHDVSFDLVPGTVTALVGPSGAGKSTVLSVLLGFVPPTSGRVGVGDLALADLDPDAWRAHVAFVPQHPYLPNSRLADAVRLGRPSATDDQVRAALAAAGLDPGDPAVRATLPDGIDTVLGEGGAQLSSGQRRRVALARAFCRESPVVLLDEPTAALDGATEQVVVDAIAALRDAGRTVLVVAHRPSLVRVADVVVALDAPSPGPPDLATSSGTDRGAELASVTAAWDERA